MKQNLTLILFFLTCNILLAQEEGFHEHDGFYLSMSIGPVFGKITDDMSSTKLEFTGTGGQFDLKIGGKIGKNLLLHGTAVSSLVTGPSINDGTHTYKAKNSTSIGETTLGIGLTYYFMPSNIFISGSLGIGNFTIEDSDNNINVSTDQGFSFQLKAGKEWWVGKNWGLGVGITYGKTNLTNKAQGVTEKLDSNRIGILFNTTFN